MGHIKIGKYYGSDLNMSKYQFKTVLDVDYTDISSINNWFSVGTELNYDYLKIRNGAKQYVTDIGYSGLTDETEKILASQQFLIDKGYRDLCHTEEQQYKYWGKFINSSKDCRTERWYNAKAYTSFTLSELDSVDLALSTKELSENYIEYNIPYLFDWLNGEGQYSGGTGFSTKSYYTEDLKNNILNKLNGE